MPSFPSRGKNNARQRLLLRLFLPCFSRAAAVQTAVQTTATAREERAAFTDAGESACFYARCDGCAHDVAKCATFVTPQLEILSREKRTRVLDFNRIKMISLTDEGFLRSASMILASEIGDKTFFIAAILAMNHSRLTVRYETRLMCLR
jgi:hypothetical protein